MSQRYKGGRISATPPTPSASSAGGIWTMQQQMQAVASNAWPPNGPFYIEDVFSTWLYTGTDSAQTIINGIDLSGKGGLVWYKRRGPNTGSNYLIDSARGQTKFLVSNTTAAQDDFGDGSFNSNGFTTPSTSLLTQASGNTYATWTFRKAEKFFDVVTYTGNGTAGRTISHNLGSVPGVIIVKRTDTTSDWRVYHRSLGATYYLGLDSTAAAAQATTIWNDTEPTSTVFSVGSSANTNASGGTYVAYLFAHDAGGFGANGTDNVISCGSFTTDGSGAATLTLNYEPQFIIIKNASSAENWITLDNMRGWTNGSGGEAVLNPNLSDAESAGNYGNLTSTGATWANLSVSKTYIYIAIRRGPMKTPESGTSVYQAATAINASPAFISGFPVDAALSRYGLSSAGDNTLNARLTNTQYLVTNSTAAQTAASSYTFDFQNGWRQTDGSASTNQIAWMFGRAPGFFDVVCYTGTGANRTVAHNLGAVPELMIVKIRNTAVTANWQVYHKDVGATKYLELNLTSAAQTSSTRWNDTAPTASVFSIGTANGTNYDSTASYVAYLFASCPGVSKVGSYTGTGTTLQVNCGFTGGARFVLIKRTDSTGDWYVWDSARGIVAGNDPYLLLNSSAAEVTNTDYVDTYSAGFEISSTAPAAINANGGTFIFLAIA